MINSIKKLIELEATEFLIESHDAMSAIIAEKLGFKGIWASSFTMSTKSGVRDRNELSVTQILNNLEQMKDATNIPILLDADTGYGDYNNVKILVKKLCK